MLTQHKAMEAHMKNKETNIVNKDADPVSAPSSQGTKNFTELDTCLGYPSLLHGESLEDFDTLLNNLMGDIEPKGSVEFIYVRDFAVYTIEIERLRLHRNILMDIIAPEAIEKMRARQSHSTFKCKMAGSPWAEQSQLASALVHAYLNDKGTKGTAINAQSFALAIDEMEKIERMIGLAEERRMRLVREIDRRHALLKNRLHETIQNRDGSFSFSQVKGEAMPQADRPLS